jgi:phosphate-selective porin
MALNTVKVLLALGLAASAAQPAHAAPVAPAHVSISEDSPGWDCATMGNGKCGPGPVNAQ